MFGAILNCVLGLFLGLASAQAAPMLQVDSNGILTGAARVVVEGKLYDLEFVDGNCESVFSGCNSATDFTFHTERAARAASRSLTELIFLDGAVGKFDTFPNLTNGCAAFDLCVAFTPFSIISGAAVALGSANFNRLDDSLAFPEMPTFFSITLADTTFENDTVWARWSPTLRVVPVPQTAICLGVGLLALVATRRGALSS